MTAKGHVVLAVTPLSAFYGSGLIYEPVVLLAVIISALLPDIDEPGSYLGRRFYFMSGIFRDLGLEHRGFTHFFFIPLSIMLLGFIIQDGIGLFFWIGFGILMHDLGDLLTKSGINSFFYPLFEGKKIGLLPKRLRFRTFSFTEKIVIFLLIVSNIYFLTRGVSL